jgi:hypothetical protein
MPKRAWPEGARWKVVRVTRDYVLWAIGILDLFVFSSFLPLGITGSLFLGVLWAYLLGEVWLVREGVPNVDPWRSKIIVIGLPPVLSMMTALFLPFDTLPILLISILGGVFLSWALLKIARFKVAPLLDTENHSPLTN